MDQMPMAPSAWSFIIPGIIALIFLLLMIAGAVAVIRLLWRLGSKK